MLRLLCKLTFPFVSHSTLPVAAAKLLELAADTAQVNMGSQQLTHIRLSKPGTRRPCQHPQLASPGCVPGAMPMPAEKVASPGCPEVQWGPGGVCRGVADSGGQLWPDSCLDEGCHRI